jgi:Trypsin-like peptidase domain
MPGRSVCVSAPSARAIGPVSPERARGWSTRTRFARSIGAHLSLTRSALCLLLLCLGCARAAAGCVDPATLTHSTVSITRHFSEEERKAEAGLLGIRGTGWFLSPTSMATAGHVAEAMRLTSQDWKEIEILDADHVHSIAVRVQQLAGSHAEKIAVLELQRAFAGGRSLKIRTEPLVPEEPLVSLGYPKNRLRFAGGRFVEYGGGDKFAGTALLELYDGDDRLVLDHGASGAPVLDCEGRVVALVSNLFTQTMRFFSDAVRISTAWGSANVVSVPIQALRDARSE